MDMTKAFTASDRMTPEIEAEIGLYMMGVKPTKKVASDNIKPANYGLPRGDRVMEFLKENRGATCREVADFLCSGQTSVANLLARLVDRGSVEMIELVKSTRGGKRVRTYGVVSDA